MHIIVSKCIKLQGYFYSIGLTLKHRQLQHKTHPSLERFPDGVSIAHVSKYPENDYAGLEPVHSSLGEIAGWMGEKTERQKDARRKIKQKKREEGNKLSAEEWYLCNHIMYR